MIPACSAAGVEVQKERAAAHTAALIRCIILEPYRTLNTLPHCRERRLRGSLTF
jgi:hypothetical protein